MWAIIVAGAKRFGGWIVAALSFLAMLATVWLTSRKVGKAEGQAEASEQRAADREAIAIREVNEAREASETKVKAVQNANEVASNNAVLDDDGVSKRLRDEWSRD